MEGDNDLTHSGFYGQGMYDFGPYFLVGRYGQFEADGEESINRLALGGGWIVQEGCEMRVEHQINDGPEAENSTLLQLVDKCHDIVEIFCATTSRKNDGEKVPIVLFVSSRA